MSDDTWDNDPDGYVEFPDVPALPRPTTGHERALVAAYRLRLASRAVLAAAGVTIGTLGVATRDMAGGLALGLIAGAIAFETTPLDATNFQNVVTGVAFFAGAVVTEIVCRRTGWGGVGEDFSFVVQHLRSENAADRADTAAAMLDARYDNIQPRAAPSQDYIE